VGLRKTGVKKKLEDCARDEGGGAVVAQGERSNGRLGGGGVSGVTIVAGEAFLHRCCGNETIILGPSRKWIANCLLGCFKNENPAIWKGISCRE